MPVQTQFRPSLACKDATWDHFRAIIDNGHLLYASAKLDGIRAVVLNGKLVSRTLKPIRNYYIQELLGRPEFEGLDGELIVGAAAGEGVYRRTDSGVMSYAGSPDFTFYVFDHHVFNGPYEHRFTHLKTLKPSWPSHDRIQLLDQTPITAISQLEQFEQRVIDEGYEGAIVRWAGAPYKQGRSTLRESYMLKLKRFLEREAKINGFVELQHNDNEATKDERGYTARSGHQANKRPGNTLGALRVQDLDELSWQFNVGTGFDAALRQHIWDNQDKYLSKIIKYRYFPVGDYDVPRHPVFHGFRDPSDL